MIYTTGACKAHVSAAPVKERDGKGGREIITQHWTTFQCVRRLKEATKCSWLAVRKAAAMSCSLKALLASCKNEATSEGSRSGWKMKHTCQPPCIACRGR